MGGNPPNPYLAREISGLVPGTALDAGCGAGAEAIWLASHGWQVTAADISSEALARAAERAAAAGGWPSACEWVEADLSVWEPGTRFDLVTTHYAHPAMPQLEFYDRIAGWVAPGGTLLIVGHLHTQAPRTATREPRPRRPPSRRGSVTAAAITRGLDGPRGRSSPPKSTSARSPAAEAEGHPPRRRRARRPTPLRGRPGSVPGLELDRNRSGRGLGNAAGEIRPAGRRRQLRLEGGAHGVELSGELLELG